MGSRGNDGETETIRVNSGLVGLIIGRNGENLRKVESESGARVQFIQAKDSHVAERQCTIAGSLRARESAKAAIYQIIEENGGTPAAQEKGAYSANMPGRAKVNLPALREGEASTQIMVPDKTVGLIIGRGGETIKDLQERSGCHVNIVGENKSVNGLRPVNLIGSERATAMAKELILEIVESDSRGGGGGGGGSGSNAAAPTNRDRGYDAPAGGQRHSSGGPGSAGAGGGGGRDHIEKTIRVPSEAVGMIIGKGGETIKDMQRTTGCKINVNQPKPPDVTRNIDLAGDARSMAEAERIIWEKVETVRQRDAAAGRTVGGGQAGGRDSTPRYDAYSQSQAAPPVPGYGQYMGATAPQVPPQMPAFQMPMQQQAAQPAAQPSNVQGVSNDAYAQWYAQWYQQMLQNGQQPGGGAPGTQ
jgi:transcription antitermination factor NusA-like protein